MKRRKKQSVTTAPSGCVAWFTILCLTLVGLVLIGTAIANLVPASRAHLLLHRHAAGGVSGSLSYYFAGVPIFWRSLDGLDRVVDQNYVRYEFGNRSHRFEREATISRVGFVDAQGRTLAWSERGSLLNQRSRITDFLQSGDSRFVFQEDVSTREMQSSWAVVKTVVGAAAVATLGLLIVIVCLRGAWIMSRNAVKRTANDAVVAGL